VICLDKTGTLTEGRIILDEIQALEPSLKERTEQVLAAFAIEPNSPTLQALHDSISTPSAVNAAYVVPFSSARKWSAMRVDGEYWIMGAPEMVWPNSGDELSQRVNEISQRGKRVLILVKTNTEPGSD